jgi:UDP-3-O-[3-hydroxymyristoyl] N-acetylglucosamine deacetylase
VTRQVVVEGFGLHTGAPVRVVARAARGPFLLVQGRVEASLAALRVASTARATTVEAEGGALRLGTVEHAFAALAGMSLHGGVSLQVDGPELPLLDGGASAWCAAFATLGVPPSPPRLRIARRALLEVGPSRYELVPGDHPPRIEVRLEIDDPRLALDARWEGDADDFVTRIAPARTFALASEVEELVRRGLARRPDPESVVVISPDAIHSSGRPFSADEPARHKLLDLMGDLYLHGGPPTGSVRATRPGHASNARAFRRAIDDGVLVPT